MGCFLTNAIHPTDLPLPAAGTDNEDLEIGVVNNTGRQAPVLLSDEQERQLTKKTWQTCRFVTGIVVVFVVIAILGARLLWLERHSYQSKRFFRTDVILQSRYVPLQGNIYNLNHNSQPQ